MVRVASPPAGTSSVVGPTSAKALPAVMVRSVTSTAERRPLVKVPVRSTAWPRSTGPKASSENSSTPSSGPASTPVGGG